MVNCFAMTSDPGTQTRIQPSSQPCECELVSVDCSQLNAERRCFRTPSSQLTTTWVLEDDSILTGMEALFEFLAAAGLSVVRLLSSVLANVTIASDIAEGI